MATNPEYPARKVKATKAAAPRFAPARGASSVRVSPGKGGKRIGPTECSADRAHFYSH